VLKQRQSELESSTDFHALLRAQGAVQALKTLLLNLKQLYDEMEASK
jgi:hypothetical protein